MTDMPYRDVEANGLRMRIADQGTGPVVLLCHGFPETAYAWRHQIEALSAQGYRVIAPDLRGFGGTDAPETVEAYALQMLVGDEGVSGSVPAGTFSANSLKVDLEARTITLDGNARLRMVPGALESME